MNFDLKKKSRWFKYELSVWIIFKKPLLSTSSPQSFQSLRTALYVLATVVSSDI
jgi:hypothetical protein